MEGPAAVILNDPGGHQEAGARHVAVGAQRHTGTAEEAGLPQEPQAVARGDPVVPEILGVAVAGQGIVLARVKGPVHGGDEIGVHVVVGVKDEEALVPGAPLRLQAVEQVVHGVALAHLDLVEALVDDGARLPGDGGGVVGAVVGHHVHVQQLGRVVLSLEILNQICYDIGLVAGTDDRGVPVLPHLLLQRAPLAAGQADHQVHQLIEIGQRQNHRQQQIEISDK